MRTGRAFNQRIKFKVHVQFTFLGDPINRSSPIELRNGRINLAGEEGHSLWRPRGTRSILDRGKEIKPVLCLFAGQANPHCSTHFRRPYDLKHPLPTHHDELIVALHRDFGVRSISASRGATCR